MLDSVCRTGTRLRSSTRIAVFHHYVTVRLADAVSLDLFVRLLATVPAADTLLADLGMTAPVLPLCAPLCPPKSRHSGTTPVRSRPSQFLGLVGDFAKTESVFESALCELRDLRDPMIAGYSRSAERVAGGMWAEH